MKKQLLIAAVAATMGTAVIADVSITGSGKMNYTNIENQTAANTNKFSNELDLNITGKHGDTTVFFNIENLNANGTGALNTKAAYMSTKVGDINVKTGSWYGSDSLLGNGTVDDNRIDVNTTFEGVKVQYEAVSNATVDSDSVTISGTVQGVSLSHEMHGNDNTDTKVSGSVAGVNVAWRQYDVDKASGTTQDKDSLEVTYTTNGVTLTYAEVDVDNAGTTTSDAFFGTQATAVGDMSGFGLKTTMAGNTVQLRSYDINPDNASGSKDNEYVKVIVTRPMAAGTTFEATYTDKDDKNGTANSETLDLELAVKF